MKKIRITIDIVMTVLLPMLMAYSLIGEKFHEIIGTGMLVLFICHNWLNRGFWKGLFKGKYNPQRIFRAIVNVALLVMVILQPLSGIAMSKYLYTFLPQMNISAAARQVHLVLAYWAFVVMSVHAGTHFSMFVPKLTKRMNKTVKSVAEIGCLVIAGYGVYAFIKRQLPDYMFMKMSFAFLDYSEPRVYFFLDYIAIMLLFAVIGYLIIAGPGMLSRKNRRE